MADQQSVGRWPKHILMVNVWPPALRVSATDAQDTETQSLVISTRARPTFILVQTVFVLSDLLNFVHIVGVEHIDGVQCVSLHHVGTRHREVGSD